MRAKVSHFGRARGFFRAGPSIGRRAPRGDGGRATPPPPPNSGCTLPSGAPRWRAVTSLGAARPSSRGCTSAIAAPQRHGAGPGQIGGQTADREPLLLFLGGGGDSGFARVRRSARPLLLSAPRTGRSSAAVGRSTAVCGALSRAHDQPRSRVFDPRCSLAHPALSPPLPPPPFFLLDPQKTRSGGRSACAASSASAARCASAPSKERGRQAPGARAEAVGRAGEGKRFSFFRARARVRAERDRERGAEDGRLAERAKDVWARRHPKKRAFAAAPSSCKQRGASPRPPPSPTRLHCFPLPRSPRHPHRRRPAGKRKGGPARDHKTATKRALSRLLRATLERRACGDARAFRGQIDVEERARRFKR